MSFRLYSLIYIYTNIQSYNEDLERFIYAGYLAIPVEDNDLLNSNLKKVLGTMTGYYEENTLCPNLA